jgi:hypothetical protein
VSRLEAAHAAALAQLTAALADAADAQRHADRSALPCARVKGCARERACVRACRRERACVRACRRASEEAGRANALQMRLIDAEARAAGTERSAEAERLQREAEKKAVEEAHVTAIPTAVQRL